MSLSVKVLAGNKLTIQRGSQRSGRGSRPPPAPCGGGGGEGEWLSTLGRSLSLDLEAHREQGRSRSWTQAQQYKREAQVKINKETTVICLIINRKVGSSRPISGNIGPDVLQGESFCSKNLG